MGDIIGPRDGINHQRGIPAGFAQFIRHPLESPQSVNPGKIVGQAGDIQGFARGLMHMPHQDGIAQPGCVFDDDFIDLGQGP